MKDLSYKTAITRTKISAPTRLLFTQGKFNKDFDVLDYGCGKGFDADTLGFDKYDPHYFNTFPTKQYDIIVCNYVLNVVPKELELGIIREIKALLKPMGTAYITVRRDIKKEGITKTGTFQRNVHLPFVIHEENNNYCMYRFLIE